MRHAPRRGLMGTAALALALSAPALGQQTSVTMAARTDPVAARTSTAQALRSQAAALYGTVEEWRQVADLRAEAARVAPLSDPERLEDLRMAGQLAAHLGDFREAERFLAEAAMVALAFGDPTTAATILISATAAAIQAGDFETARGHLARVGLLVECPLMPAEFRDHFGQAVASGAEALARLEQRREKGGK